MFVYDFWFWLLAGSGLVACAGIPVPSFRGRFGNLAAPWLFAVLVFRDGSAWEAAILLPVSSLLLYVAWKCGIGYRSPDWPRRTTASLGLLIVAWAFVGLFGSSLDRTDGFGMTLALASVAGVWALGDSLFQASSGRLSAPLDSVGVRFAVLDSSASFFASISLGAFAVFVSVLGVWAGVVSLIPLVVIGRLVASLVVARRVEGLALRAIGRLPEAAGLIESDHATAVEELSVALGISLGIRGRELDELASAAMLHEVGLVIYSGSDRLRDGYSKRDVAKWGKSLLGHSPALGVVAQIIGDQAEPYRFPGADPDPDLDIRSQVVHIACEMDNLRRLGLRATEIIDELGHQTSFRFSPRVVAEVPGALARVAANGRLTDVA